MSETAERTNDAVSKFASNYLEKVAPAYERVAKGIRAVEAGVVMLGEATAEKALLTVGENASKIATAILDQVFATFEKEVMSQLSAMMVGADGREPPELVRIREGLSKAKPTQLQDAYITPGTDRAVIATGFGQLDEQLYEIRPEDAVTIKPERAPGAAPQPEPQQAQRTNLPAVSDTIRASLQGVGTSLRIELDVGQLTELVLRDIMMNKPNVFGGIG